MSTNNIGFYEDLTKIIFQLSSNMSLVVRKPGFLHIGLFQKKITFLVRKFQKFCVWLLTLYAFIICQVIIRTQYYTIASLISAPVVILYQNVRGA